MSTVKSTKSAMNTGGEECAYVSAQSQESDLISTAKTAHRLSRELCSLDRSLLQVLLSYRRLAVGEVAAVKAGCGCVLVMIRAERMVEGGRRLAPFMSCSNGRSI